MIGRLRSVAFDAARLAGDDAIAARLERDDAGAMDEGGALRKRTGQGRHQHRLLGVGRTPHAAVAEVPATLDVAPDRRRRDAELFAAAAKGLVVLVGRDRPWSDRQALLHALEP